ncbi:parallel beta helix pectate lyase-like protein [Pseudonocardia hierapolitana]|uniref:Parallel beta helix pectate lyase-like protein n=1 Tax=Pseudonocardia hierapolitana TaxID=1128676 RepID=A0A561SYI0_9PSEU|nr:right-handed parallel beta-helix repeat-containing protein [Pseudonocardia hierapolitana]TWF79928.1 parallel beta helix pectate lyase-like protein [Pseudonocardia hierapolitana]
MNTGTTSKRWVGRLLAAGMTTALGLGLAAGTAVAAPTATPMAQTVTQAVAQPTQVVTPDTAASVRRAWEARGRPHRMVVVRDFRIDLATDGRVTRQVGRAGGNLTISALDQALPSDWLTVTDGTATLDATLVLTRGVSMQLGGSGSTLRTLQLAGGATPADAASIHTGGGRVALNGITVASIDLATGQPLPSTAKGRPTIVASGGGRLDVTDVTINDLGTVSDGTPGSDERGAAAVEFRTASTGSLVRTTVARGSTGVELSHSQGVHLEQLTVSDSADDGLVLAGDQGTSMSGIRATGNGANGVLVSGQSGGRPITGISTNANGAFGVAVVGESGTQISAVDTTADEAGGLRISRSTNIGVTGYTATDQRMGVFTHVNSSGIVLDGIQTTGGARGLVVEKSTSHLEAKNSTFSGARVAGAALNGADIALNGVHVTGSRSAVRVDRGAHDIRLTGLTVDGGRDGLVTAAGTSGLVVTDLTVNDVASDAVRSFTPDARITGAEITGGGTGLDLAAGATITNSTIVAAREGIRSRSPEPVYASGVTVDTTELGVNSAEGSPFTLVNSNVHALESVRGVINQQGTNDLSLPPLNLLGAIGIPLIILAVVLEELHSYRQRRLGGATRRRRPPLPVEA